MSNVRLEISDEAVQALLHEVGETVCADHARRIAGACGKGFSYSVKDVGKRTVASVTAFEDGADPDEILRHLR